MCGARVSLPNVDLTLKREAMSVKSFRNVDLKSALLEKTRKQLEVIRIGASPINKWTILAIQVSLHPLDHREDPPYLADFSGSSKMFNFLIFKMTQGLVGGGGIGMKNAPPSTQFPPSCKQTNPLKNAPPIELSTWELFKIG